MVIILSRIIDLKCSKTRKYNIVIIEILANSNKFLPVFKKYKSPSPQTNEPRISKARKKNSIHKMPQSFVIKLTVHTFLRKKFAHCKFLPSICSLKNLTRLLKQSYVFHACERIDRRSAKIHTRDWQNDQRKRRHFVISSIVTDSCHLSESSGKILQSAPLIP